MSVHSITKNQAITPLRAVVDTSVMFSALGFNGPRSQEYALRSIDLALNQGQLVTSPATRAALVFQGLSEPITKKLGLDAPKHLIERMCRFSNVVNQQINGGEGPADIWAGLATLSGATYLVTENRKLLDRIHVGRCHIVRPESYLRAMRAL